MILQELCGLYERLVQDPELHDKIPERGWSLEKVAWALVIGEDGHVLGLQPLGGDKQRNKEMLVPEHAGRSGKFPTPYLLCDKASYLLGLDEKNGPGNRVRSRDFHEDVLSGCSDEGARAALAFFSAENPAACLSAEDCERLGDGKMIVLCLRRSSDPIFDRPAVRSAWHHHLDIVGKAGVDEVGYCSVTGQKAPLARLFPQVTGVPGAQSSGASLVSFNFEASKSYGKDQAYNASISEDAAFRAGIALKYLLGNSSRRVSLGGTIMTYWTDAPSRAADEVMGWLFGKSLGSRAEDKPTLDAVSTALEEMRRGRVPSSFNPEVGYCILGVSPNAARLSVRYFERGTLGELAKRFGQYLRDMEIVGVSRAVAPWQALMQTASLGKADGLPQTLVAETMRAMLRGAEFPRSLETLVLARMRADHAGRNKWDLGQRAAILKACRNRRLRLRGVHPDEKESIDVSLNKENSNLGYLTGRLFAVLERAQQEAVKGANATIRDRYIGAASTTPARVIQPLLRNCQAHLAAIRKDGGKAWLSTRLERELDEIVGRLMPGNEGFPKTLDSDDQGLFFIGYYQERCALWEKSEKENSAGAIDSTSNDGSSNLAEEE